MAVREAQTIDLQVVFFASTWAQRLTRVLGATIAPNNSVTNQAYLGQSAEAASIHAVGYSVDFSTLYDSGETDFLRTQSQEVTNPMVVLFDEDDVLKHFWMAEANILSLGEEAPQTDAITDPFSTPISDIPIYGLGASSVTRLEFTADNSMINLPDFSKDAEVYVVMEEVGDGLTEFTITAGVNVLRVPIAAPSGHKVELPAAFPANVSGATIEVAAARTGKGFVFIGEKEMLPSG